MNRILALGASAALAASAVAFAQSDAGAAARKTAPAWYDLRRLAPVQGDAAAGQAKSEVCAACHGANGTATAPTFPNLAGQSASYLYWELVEYKDGSLPESPMTPPAAALNDADMKDLAAYFASQAPAAAADGAATPDPALLQRGEQLYLSGDPGKGIPPCQGCHGAEARGHALAQQVDRSGRAPYAIYPALRGQRQAYLQARLNDFHQGELGHSSNDRVMTGVGARLDDESIRALSAWLTSLPP